MGYKRHGKKHKASWLFFGLKCGETRFLYPVYYVNEQACYYLSTSKIKNKEGKPELQIVIPFNRPENAQELYKERRQIETGFKALKSSGFNIENTHFADLKRIERLFLLVMVAFLWAYLVGIFHDENVKPIKILKHQQRAKSLIKYGLEYIVRILSNPMAKPDFDIFEFLSYS